MKKSIIAALMVASLATANTNVCNSLDEVLERACQSDEICRSMDEILERLEKFEGKLVRKEPRYIVKKAKKTIVKKSTNKQGE